MLYARQNEVVQKAVHLKQTTVKGTLLFQMSFQAKYQMNSVLLVKSDSKTVL